MKKHQLYLVGLLIGLVLFFGVNILSAKTLRSLRVDLTEGGLYSLSDGTRNILANLEEPITLTFFFSEEVSNEIPQIRQYAIRVKELLQEYELLSGGMIDLQIVDPEPFSEEEDLATQAGVAPVPLGNLGGDKLYLGLAGANSTDDEAAIPFFNPENEPLLEYDITKLVYTLTDPERAVVGVLTSLPMSGAPAANPMMGRGEPPWVILDQLRGSFDVRELDTTLVDIDDDIDVLMIVHPKQLPASTKYAIDQYVLRGGRVLAFVDPWAEVDAPPPGDQMAAFSYDRSSSLDPLLESWGLRMLDGKIAADRSMASPRSGFDVDYVAWLTIDDSTLDDEDATVSLLEGLRLAAAGVLQEVADSQLAVTPLITTTTDSTTIDRSQIQFAPDARALLSNFVPEDEELMLAARVTGPAQTAYPGGPPAPAEGEEPYLGSNEHLDASASDINVIVVADADMVYDYFWIQQQSLGGLVLGYRKLSDNGDFIVNCVDNLSGSNDLISIRGGQKFARPFELVQEIERRAQQDLFQREQELEAEIRSTQERLDALQREREDGSSLILTPEQLEEIENLRDKQLATRKELRAVRHEMEKDIERLGFLLKIVHIALVPLTFSLGAFAFSVWRSKRRA